jgi:hypothetical protein
VAIMIRLRPIEPAPVVEAKPVANAVPVANKL